MRKISIIIIVFLVVACLPIFANAIAEQSVENNAMLDEKALQELSIDELLTLQTAIQKALADKGYVNYEELDRGSKGEAVSDVQERLKELGYYTGSLTGKYDSETQKAFKQFEKSNSLTSDGKASRNDLVILFSSAAEAKTTPVPTKDAEKASKKANEKTPEGYLPFTDFDYTEFFRYPEKYYGTKIVLKGRVVQVLGSRTSGFEIRLATSGYDDVVYIKVRFDPGFNILEDDRLIVCAEMRDTLTYTATLGNSVTIPSAIADSITIN